jgi:hypothetical protein
MRRESINEWAVRLWLTVYIASPVPTFVPYALDVPISLKSSTIDKIPSF